MSFDNSDFLLSSEREDELKEMLSLIPRDIGTKLHNWIRSVVKEKNELSHRNPATCSLHGAYRSLICESRNLELMISNVATPLLTGDPIEGVGCGPVQVLLVNSLTKEKVTSGPEASGKVEIGVVEAEDDCVKGNEFKRKLLQQTEGNRSISVGKLCLKLVEGTALLPKVSFVHNQGWQIKSKIRLQARCVYSPCGVQVKEAHTDPFYLMDRRTKAYKKHPIPSLDDKVWRLYNISFNGLLARSLRGANITTVRDFIVSLFLHPQRIEEIFDNAKHAKSLEATVKHARECPTKLKYYCSSSDQKTEVIFNVSGELLGLYLDDQFISEDTLSKNQKEVYKNLVTSAFENWRDVVILKEDQFVARCSPHLLNKSVFLNGHDLHINEASLFDNLFPDEQSCNPEHLSEPLRKRNNEIYHEFQSFCTTDKLEPEPVFGLVVREAAKENRFYKRWRMVFCLVAFRIGSFPKDSRAHKKQRLSY